MATTTKLEEARDRVAGELAGRQGVGPAALGPAALGPAALGPEWLGPEWLGLIGEAVLAVLEDCLGGRTKEEVAAAMRSPGLLEWFAVRRAVRGVLSEAFGPLSFASHGGSQLAEALIAAARSAADEDRVGLLDEVSGRREP
jgi:hypothetical protein